jgi:hypothetical protein
VVAAFDGGTITSDAGALLLREVDAANRTIEQFASCFTDHRDPAYVEHSVKDLLSQRVIGLCLGYEDTVDHDELRKDPLLATVCGKLDPTGADRRYERDRGIPLAGKSTLNRLETFAVGLENPRYKKISCCEEKVEEFFIDSFIRTTPEVPKEIVLDLDATDTPLHGHQEGRFFHGYYDCYCYLPLYIFCGDRLVYVKLKTANLDPGHEALPDLKKVVQRIRSHWPEVRIIVRGDSGFCRDDLLSWCEENGVFYIIGLARNTRLCSRIRRELKKARKKFFLTRQPQRVFSEFTYRTRTSWSAARRVVAKAEYLAKGENPRFLVSNLDRQETAAQVLYEKVYCARGEMENRIKEQQLYLFADRTSSTMMSANQIRLYLSAVAYVLMNELRQKALAGTDLETAQCHTIRAKLLKLGAQVRVSVRRVAVSLASSYPYQSLFHQIVANLQRAYPQLC